MAHQYVLKPTDTGEVYVLEDGTDTAAICPSWARARRVQEALSLFNEVEAQRARRRDTARRAQRLAKPHRRRRSAHP